MLLTHLYLEEPKPRLVAWGKGSRERSVYLSPQAEKALRRYLRQRPASTDEHVFLSYQLAGLSTTAIHYRLMIFRRPRMSPSPRTVYAIHLPTICSTPMCR